MSFEVGVSGSEWIALIVPELNRFLKVAGMASPQTDCLTSLEA